MEPSLPERQWPLHGRIEFFWRRARHHGKALRMLSPRERRAYLASHAEPMINRFRRMLGAKVVGSSPYHRAGLPPGLAETREAGWAAIQCHELKPYPGKATLFVSEKGNTLGCDTLLAYPKLLQGVRDPPVQRRSFRDAARTACSAAGGSDFTLSRRNRKGMIAPGGSQSQRSNQRGI